MQWVRAVFPRQFYECRLFVDDVAYAAAEWSRLVCIKCGICYWESLKNAPQSFWSKVEWYVWPLSLSGKAYKLIL